MSANRLRLAPGVPDLAALGARSPDDLLAPEGLATFARARVRVDERGDVIALFPLPGTPDAAGRVHERPRGAGTGWARLVVRRGGLARALAARWSEPRSASPAERDWNLSCHLAREGVPVPEPMAVVARGGLGPSALVTRAATGMAPFERWIHSDASADGDERRLGVEAVGRFLARLARSRAVLPLLRPAGVLVELRAPDAGGACERPAGGLALRRLPGVMVQELRCGRIVGSAEHGRARDAVGWLASELAALVRPDERALLAPSPERAAAVPV